MFLMLGSYCIIAQHSLKKDIDFNLLVGPGHINFIQGTSIQNNLTYGLGRLFSAELNFTYVNAREGLSNFGYSTDNLEVFQGYYKILHCSIYSIGTDIYFTPVNIGRHLLGIGGGLSLNYQVEDAAYIAEGDRNNQVGISNRTSYGPGIDLGVKYSYLLTDKILLGAKWNGIYHNDSSGSFLVSVGYRLSACNSVE